MITTTRPGVGEYAPSFADYVDRIADDVIAGHVRHHLQILEERYTE